MTAGHGARFTGLEGNPVRMNSGPFCGGTAEAFASRALLVRSGPVTLLVDAGPGLCSTAGNTGNGVHMLASALAGYGLAPADITHIILTHLHQDHCGGVLAAGPAAPRDLLFPEARIFASGEQLARSASPRSGDWDLFIPGLAGALESSGRLLCVAEDDCLYFDGLTVRFMISHGHTPGMLVPLITAGDTLVCAGSDLIPGAAWLRPALRLGRNRFSERLTGEKQRLLNRVAGSGGWLFYPHGYTAASTVVREGEIFRTRDETGAFDIDVPGGGKGAVD